MFNMVKMKLLQAFYPQRQRFRREPGAALFLGLRLRLTLWYTGILATALVLFCCLLYFGVQHLLFYSVQNDLLAHMHERIDQCNMLINDQDGSSPDSSDTGQPSSLNNVLLACFDTHGQLLSSASSSTPSAFLTDSVVLNALHRNGAASDTVNCDGTIGSVYRYAQVFVDHDLGDREIVVVVGAPVKDQETALNDLLLLLAVFGALTLVGAGIGGLFLANRAIAPARLAFTRQQRFIADASHELRTPLTLMRADAEVLLRGRERFDEETVVFLEDIVAEANHMTRLANSMLTLARLDVGNRHHEFEVVYLNELALAAVRRISAFAHEKNVTVQSEAANEVLVIGDPMLLEQAVFILLDNAVKYNRDGGHIDVCTRIEDDYAVMEVRDTGIGIAAEHLAHLGERFYRVDKARSREIGGTGLGLSIAYGIAVTHNGTLMMSSVPDQGTTVMLKLPIARRLLPDQGSQQTRGTDIPPRDLPR